MIKYKKKSKTKFLTGAYVVLRSGSGTEVERDGGGSNMAGRRGFYLSRRD